MTTVFFEAPDSPDATILIDALTAHAIDAGVLVLRLETGVRQHAAVAFYRRQGFVEIPPFPPYGPDPESVFMERRVPVSASRQT